MTKNPFGILGDFITAPNISRLFSEMIAIWTISFWKSLGSPKKFNLIELGAGNGQMMRVFIESFQRFPIFLNSCNFIIHEKSPSLIKIQKKDKVLCAKFRKGHFEGVIEVMDRLTKIINPKKIYMGEKDFQQLYLVKKQLEKKYKTVPQ